MEQTLNSLGHTSVINRDAFDELFLLHLANNHWGDIERGGAEGSVKLVSG